MSQFPIDHQLPPYQEPLTAQLIDASGQPVGSPTPYPAGCRITMRLDQPAEPPPGPGPEPAGRYGGGWPTVPADATKGNLRPGGNNNIDFGDCTIIDGESFSKPGELGLALTDCKGMLILKNCTISNSRQGLVTRMTRSDFPAPTVFCIECLFLDNHVVGMSGLPAELACYYQSKAPGGFFGQYGSIFINSGWTGEERDKGTDPTEYDHDIYVKGDIVSEAIDCLSIRPSSQFHKGMGRWFHAIRNVILEPAIGLGCGQEKQNTLRPSDPLSYASLVGNLIYGARDLPASNQRLGWGIAVQGANMTAEHNIICSPNSENNNLPAFRFNECDGLVDNARIRNNHIYGYKNIVEIDSQSRSYTPEIELTDNTVSMGTMFAKERREGSSSKLWQVGTKEVVDPRIVLDVDAIEAKARRREITAADVLAMARAQMGGK